MFMRESKAPSDVDALADNGPSEKTENGLFWPLSAHLHSASASMARQSAKTAHTPPATTPALTSKPPHEKTAEDEDDEEEPRACSIVEA